MTTQTPRELDYAVTGEDLYYLHSRGRESFKCKASNVRQYVIVSGKFSTSVAKESQTSDRVRTITILFLKTLCDEMRKAAGFAPDQVSPSRRFMSNKIPSWWCGKVAGAGINDKCFTFPQRTTQEAQPSAPILAFDVYRTKNRYERPFATLRVNESYADWLYTALPQVLDKMRAEELSFRAEKKASRTGFERVCAM